VIFLLDPMGSPSYDAAYTTEIGLSNRFGFAGTGEYVTRLLAGAETDGAGTAGQSAVAHYTTTVALADPGRGAVGPAEFYTTTFSISSTATVQAVTLYSTDIGLGHRYRCRAGGRSDALESNAYRR